jgi:hypothetical protein
MTEILRAANKTLLNAPFDESINMAFNIAMEPSEHPDWALVAALGGPSKVADELGYSREGGAQRVQNWKHRGIPPAVKLQRPDLFLPGLEVRSEGASPAVQEG